MENKNSFLKGFGLGSLITAMVMLIAVAGINVYLRHVNWNGIDPNTKISEIYSLLNRFSIVPFERDELLENMYRGLLDGVGDPYTQYLDAEALAAFHARTEGIFVGIGVMISEEPDEPYITIMTVYNDTPADLAGLLPGDKIISVNGTDIAWLTVSDASSLITGPENTSVTLNIFRPYENERFEVEIIRARVQVPTVFHEMHYTESGAVGYIRIESFERPTAEQFENALVELYAQGMNGLIIDLRNNPGGLFCIVNEITDRLIPEGIITYTIDADNHRENHYSGPDYLGLPLVLLVNERSASASEVLSGAVRDTQTGTIVGTQTFGKGVVQSLLYLSDDTAIKLTIQRYYTPSGDCIQGIGITPHVIVEMSDALSRRVGRLTLEEDIQLQTALEIIEGKF
jgi:carboxyl-terminal processing protease